MLIDDGRRPSSSSPQPDPWTRQHMARALSCLRLRQAEFGTRRGAGSYCCHLQRVWCRCRHRSHDGYPKRTRCRTEGATVERRSSPGCLAQRGFSDRDLSPGYLQGRGIISPPPASIRFLPRQRNWSDGKTYSAMIALVQRVPGDDECGLQSGALLIDAGAHFTFLQGGGIDGPVRKATTDACKLTLGQLRHGGVWLTPVNEINEQLAVAEGIETALSVQQITNLPTVAALSAAGMRSLRWPPQVRRLWIAADNDEVGRGAAEVLLERALRAGLQAHIKLPARGKNDFNDLLMSA